MITHTIKLVRYYDGVTGLKTGTTSKAGHCISLSATKNNMELISVILGSETSDDRFNSARKLLDYGFANFSTVKIEIDMTKIKPVKVSGGVESAVGIQEVKPFYILLEKGREKDIQQSFTLPDEIKAPVIKGQKLGKVIITLDKTMVGEAALSADRTIKKMSFGKALELLFKALFTL